MLPNHCLLGWCRRYGERFTRGRPYRKNDQAWVEGLAIRRGPPLEILNAISLHGGLVQSWLMSLVSARATVEALLEHWRVAGLPGYAQFDNDTTFQGAHQHRDSISSPD